MSSEGGLTGPTCACATPESRLEYPIPQKVYRDDTISVQSAVNLAYSAYIKGCSDRSRELNAPNSFQACVIKAKEHVDKNVLFFLDQENSGKDGKGPTEVKKPTPKR